MELVLQVRDSEMLDPALEAGAVAVAFYLDRKAAPPDIAALKDQQDQARRRGQKFYLIWDWLIPERQLAEAKELLAALAALAPDGLQIRDLALRRLSADHHPGLILHAAGAWGCFNSPALKLAEGLGFVRIAVAGPISLKDLALMRRQAAVPLEVALPPFSLCYAGLGLEEDYPPAPGQSGQTVPPPITPAALAASLEALVSLCQLGVEAVSLPAEIFTPRALARVVGLYQAVASAPSLERPRALAAARQVVEAFGDSCLAAQVSGPPEPGLASPPATRRPPSSLPPSWLVGHGPLWLEVRAYAEAVALSRPWRGPLLLTLTPGNYAAFLGDIRRWLPRRLIWRLPMAMKESSLAFFKQALATLCQGRYSRFVAGDWGGVALAQAAGGEVLGDLTLGLRNSLAVAAARELRVTRVCLPPGQGPDDWQEFLRAAGTRFWGYLYHVPTLAVCGPEAPAAEEGTRWETEDGLSLLCGRFPVSHLELTGWLKGQSIAPLVAALPRSKIPSGELPAWLRPKPPGPRPQTPGRRPPRGK